MDKRLHGPQLHLPADGAVHQEHRGATEAALHHRSAGQSRWLRVLSHQGKKRFHQINQLRFITFSNFMVRIPSGAKTAGHTSPPNLWALIATEITTSSGTADPARSTVIHTRVKVRFPSRKRGPWDAFSTGWVRTSCSFCPCTRMAKVSCTLGATAVTIRFIGVNWAPWRIPARVQSSPTMAGSTERVASAVWPSEPLPVPLWTTYMECWKYRWHW